MAGDIVVLSAAAGEFFMVDFCIANLIVCRSLCLYAHVCALPSKSGAVHLYSCARAIESSHLNGQSARVILH